MYILCCIHKYIRLNLKGQCHQSDLLVRLTGTYVTNLHSVVSDCSESLLLFTWSKNRCNGTAAQIIQKSWDIQPITSSGSIDQSEKRAWRVSLRLLIETLECCSGGTNTLCTYVGGTTAANKQGTPRYILRARDTLYLQGTLFVDTNLRWRWTLMALNFVSIFISYEETLKNRIIDRKAHKNQKQLHFYLLRPIQHIWP